MVLLLVFMQLTRDLFAIAKFLFLLEEKQSDVVRGKTRSSSFLLGLVLGFLVFIFGFLVVLQCLTLLVGLSDP